MTSVASLKYFFSILRDIKNTIIETKNVAIKIFFIFFLASNKKKLKSPRSNKLNKFPILPNIELIYLMTGE